MHTIWLDNLFTSIKLLQQLQKLGIGGAGTVQTTKTKREELDKVKGNKKKAHNQSPIKQIDQQLADLKLIYQSQIKWGTLYARLLEDKTVMEFAWKDANIVLFISTISDGSYSNLTLKLRS